MMRITLLWCTFPVSGDIGDIIILYFSFFSLETRSPQVEFEQIQKVIVIFQYRILELLQICPHTTNKTNNMNCRNPRKVIGLPPVRI